MEFDMNSYEMPLMEIIEFETQDIMSDSLETDNMPVFLD